MFRLVCSGHNALGQSGRIFLDSMSLDVLLDFGYGMLVEHAEPKEREKLDRSLRALDAPNYSNSRKVEVARRDGSTVFVTEARLAQLQANVTNINAMRQKRR
jgi:hypothetical protein